MIKALRRAAPWCLFTFSLGALSLSASAQDLLLHPGARIRFGIDTTRALHVADLGQATRDSLLLRDCQTCSRLSYSRLEVNRLAVFRRVPAGMRMVSGFGFGGVAGLALGLIAARTCHGVGDECDGSIVVVPALGLLGGLVGVLAGYLTAYSWDPVPGGH
jgi:hypothetical protein